VFVPLINLDKATLKEQIEKFMLKNFFCGQILTFCNLIKAKKDYPCVEISQNPLREKLNF